MKTSPALEHVLDTTNLAREWAKSHRDILTFIGSLVHDFSEAEELLQETAAQVFGHVDRYDSSRPFLPYAFGVAKNVVLLHQRRSGQKLPVFDPDVIDRLSIVFTELADEQDGVRLALESCRGKLPDHSRRICRMRYEGGLRPGEIARRTGASAEAMRTLLSRIRKQLKTCIQKQLGTDWELT